MTFIYSDAKEPFTGSIDFNKINATKAYLNHYDSMQILKFFHLNGTRLEKLQADKEMTICERKMTFWKRQANFDMKVAQTAIDQVNKNWSDK